jgi:hypothetical protein
MAYDYSSETKQLELPNPYRVQNQLMWVGALALACGGMLCLWWGRQAWLAAPVAAGLVPILVGLGLVSSAIWVAGVAATRLRFLFGRQFPVPLAQDIRDLDQAKSPLANAFQDVLRQGTLTYPEPSGAIDGVLYKLVQHLSTAPIQVQALARTQFFNLTAMTVTLLSFLCAWALAISDASKPWIALAYLAFGFVFLIRPVATQGRAVLSARSLVGLIAGAILGPVVLGWVARDLPSLESFSFFPQALAMLIGAVLALVLAMRAILAQVAEPPTTRRSAEQLRVSCNAPPTALMDELDRRFQETWTDGMPNKRYARVVPLIDPLRHSAPFSGELFEETQPLPTGGSVAPSLRAALASTRHRWIAALDLYGLTLTLLAVAIALYFVQGYQPGLDFAEQPLSTLGMVGVLLLLATFCQHLASSLWGRFDFESTLVWVEFTGTYQTSSIGTGNLLSSKVNANNQIVRVESMTLRVWRARIESVTFYKKEQRQITAMFSTDKEAKELAQHLAAFGAAQSVFVAPGAASDAQRLSALNGAEQSLKDVAAATLDQAGAHARHSGSAISSDWASPSAGGDMGAHGTRQYCHACGQSLAPNARFCSRCGERVVPEAA